MASSSNDLPPNVGGADLPDGGDLVNKYLNDDALAPNPPSSSPMLSSRGMTPSSDTKPKNSSATSQNGNPNDSKNAGEGGDSRGASEGPGRHRASRAGARSVSKLSAQQLARKRANDREAQRAIRQRTKEHIENLEREIRELRAQQPAWEIEQRNRELEELVTILKQQLDAERMEKAKLVGAGQAMPLGMGTDAQDLNTMSWPMMGAQFSDADAMASFDPQSVGVSRTGELTGPGNDLVTSYTNQNPGLITPYPSDSPTAGNFPDLDASTLNYGPLPGQDDLIGMPADLSTPAWTNAVNPAFQMGDPNMFSPPNRYLNADDVPYPYSTQPPPMLPSQPSKQQQQLQPPPMDSGASGPGMIKYEMSPNALAQPNQRQQVQTPQPMQQPQTSLPTPPEHDPHQRRKQQQVQQQSQQRPPQITHQAQRPVQPNLPSTVQSNSQQNRQRLQPQPQPQQTQRPRQPSLQQQAGGIPIAPAPPPQAHLQRSQPSSQTLPPTRQGQGQPHQLQRQPNQPQQQQRSPSKHMSQQIQGNMPLHPQQQQVPPQPSIPYWAQIPTFLPPVSVIDTILQSALDQHRLSVRNGATNQRAPDYSALIAYNSPTAPNPLLPASGDPAPLSSAISRAIKVAGFRGIVNQAAVLYTTHCLLRWQADPQPETYAHIPSWLRPGKMQLAVPHALWVSQLVWRGLREWVAGQGGRYIRDEFVLCYARNLDLEWDEGRSLTGGRRRVSGMGPGFDDGIFEMNGNGEVVTTSKFEATIREQSSWGLEAEFFARYPELIEMARRARDR